MIDWEDEGFLLAKRKFRENANIINVFTKNYGKVSGIVYGGNSRKVKNFLQIGNKIYINHKSKNDKQIGYFQTEIIDPISPKYFDDKKKMCSISSITAMLNILLPEMQKNLRIFNSLDDFLNKLDEKNWIQHYIVWEIYLIQELGFGIDYDKLKLKKNGKFQNFVVDGTGYEVPLFVFDKLGDVSDTDIKKGLAFTRKLIMNKFFLINNIQFPKSRITLENYF